jgi:hypothetical protein
MSQSMGMGFDSVAALAADGFTGFVSVSELQRSLCRQVSDEKGVYMVISKSTAAPAFLAESIGGHFKGRNPTVDVEALSRQWVNDVVVLYIGKAGSADGSAMLRSRLKQYMKFGLGKAVGHWGGRSIWQLADSHNLQVCWKPTPDEEPREVESRLIAAFKQRYGQRPYANLRD